MESYHVSCQITGHYACWTRPDTGDCPVSYPAPTFSAVKGIFSSVLWGPAIEIIPTTVEICAPLRYENYITNYGGPLRKSELVSNGSSYQMMSTVLVDVCYKLYACVKPMRGRRDLMPERAKQWDSRTTSPGHAYKSIFERRIARGQLQSIPFLGLKEFVPSYFGACIKETEVCSEIHQVIPSMLYDVFSDGYNSSPNFSYLQNVEIKNGVLTFPDKAGDLDAE